MKKLSLLLLLSFVVAPAVMNAFNTPQTADAAIEKHIAALGGREALAKITSRKATGTIVIGLAQGDLPGAVELYSKAPNKSRAYTEVDLSAMGMSEKMTLDQRFDGTGGWALNSMSGNAEMPASQVASQKNNIFPTQFLNYKEAGTTVAMLPSEKVDGKDAVVLMVTPKAGPAQKVYLDPVTYLGMQVVSQVEMGDQGIVEQIVAASDYRTVDGIKVAFSVVNTSPGQTVTIKLTKVEHNIALDDAMFTVK
jgi:outer membrane lipoprotein-sorting protein